MSLEMNVPFDVTWSCYWDRAVHCGTCVSCRERRGGFAKGGNGDPVAYASEGEGRKWAKRRDIYFLHDFCLFGGRPTPTRVCGAGLTHGGGAGVFGSLE